MCCTSVVRKTDCLLLVKRIWRVQSKQKNFHKKTGRSAPFFYLIYRSIYLFAAYSSATLSQLITLKKAEI